jgi:hypothetical protein
MDNKSKPTKGKYPPIKGISTLIKEGIIDFVNIDKTIFVKTDTEREALKKIRSEHNEVISAQGFNPKKLMNPY